MFRNWKLVGVLSATTLTLAASASVAQTQPSPLPGVVPQAMPQSQSGQLPGVTPPGPQGAAATPQQYVPLSVTSRPGVATLGTGVDVGIGGACTACAGGLGGPGGRCYGPRYEFNCPLYYYGNNPHHDDWFNGLCDCYDGKCGKGGYILTDAWIRLHQRLPFGVVNAPVKFLQRRPPFQVHPYTGPCAPNP